MKQHARMAAWWLAALLGSAAWAQQSPGDGSFTFSPPASPEAIKYLSGGVGDEERSQLLAQWPQFPLVIVFSASGGAYAVADSVRLSNALGAVLLEVSQAGPLLMLNLPPGDYRVLARSGGTEQERELHLDTRPLRVDWPM
jgi:hypothetical protein